MRKPTSDKPAITITRAFAKGQKPRQVDLSTLTEAEKDEMEEIFEGPIRDSDEFISDDDAPEPRQPVAYVAGVDPTHLNKTSKRKRSESWPGLGMPAARRPGVNQ